MRHVVRFGARRAAAPVVTSEPVAVADALLEETLEVARQPLASRSRPVRARAAVRRDPRDSELAVAREHQRETLEVLKLLAAREQPAPTFQVVLPEHPVAITLGSTEVHVPAPELTYVAGDTHVDVQVPEQPAPQVDVHLPEQPAPHVDVHVPEQKVAPVHVTVENPPVPASRGVRVEHDEHGRKVYVPVEVVA